MGGDPQIPALGWRVEGEGMCDFSRNHWAPIPTLSTYTLVFSLGWVGAGVGEGGGGVRGGGGCLKEEGAFGGRWETYIHLLQVTCLFLFFHTIILTKVETTHSELENFPHETVENQGVKITPEKQKWLEKCSALVYGRLDFLLCSKFEENDRKGRTIVLLLLKMWGGHSPSRVVGQRFSKGSVVVRKLQKLPKRPGTQICGAAQGTSFRLPSCVWCLYAHFAGKRACHKM